MRLISYLDVTGDRLGVEHADGRIWSSHALGAGLPGSMADLLAGGARRWRHCGVPPAARRLPDRPGDVDAVAAHRPGPAAWQGHRRRPQLPRPRGGGWRRHPGLADALRQVPHLGRGPGRHRRVGPGPHRRRGHGGRAGRRHRPDRAARAARSTALDHVLGYTCLNDVSARDLQYADKQFVRAKSLDTFCPMGPALVTADEIPDPGALAVRSYRNGELMQDGHTSDLIFSVPHLVAFCSRAFTLEPGDVIATGTPAGVGWYRDPKVHHARGRRHDHRDRGHRAPREPLPRGPPRLSGLHGTPTDPGSDGARRSGGREQGLLEDAQALLDLVAADVQGRDPAHDVVAGAAGEQQQPALGAGGR